MINDCRNLDVPESLAVNEILDSSHGLVVTALKASLSVVGITESVDTYGYRTHADISEHICNVLSYKGCICRHAPAETLLMRIAQKLGKTGIQKRFAAGNAELEFFQIKVFFDVI